MKCLRYTALLAERQSTRLDQSSYKINTVLLVENINGLKKSLSSKMTVIFSDRLPLEMKLCAFASVHVLLLK